MKLKKDRFIEKLVSISYGAVIIAMIVVPFLKNANKNAAEDLEEMLPKTPILMSVTNVEATCSINGQSITTFHSTSEAISTSKRFDLGDPNRRTIFENHDLNDQIILFFDTGDFFQTNNIVNLPILDPPDRCELLEFFDLETSVETIIPARCEFHSREGSIGFKSTCSVSVISVSDCYPEPWDGWGCSESTMEQRQARRLSDEAAWEAFQLMNE